MVNRDLARRVRNANGITQHRQVLRNDIKLSAKLIHVLDERERLWSLRPRGEGQAPQEVSFTADVLLSESSCVGFCEQF